NAMNMKPWTPPPIVTITSVVFVTYLRNIPTSRSAQVIASPIAKRENRRLGVIPLSFPLTASSRVDHLHREKPSLSTWAERRASRHLSAKVPGPSRRRHPPCRLDDPAVSPARRTHPPAASAAATVAGHRDERAAPQDQCRCGCDQRQGVC